MRSQREIDQQIDRAAEQEAQGTTKYPGMTYEEGVRYALEWVTGQADDKPMEDDE